MGLFSRNTSTPTPDSSAPRAGEFTPVDGEQLFVGENAYQSNLKALLRQRGQTTQSMVAGDGSIRESFTARLTPELDNPHDENAVRVDIDGHTVAYLSRANAALWRASLGTSIADMPVVVWVPNANRPDHIVSVWPEQ